MKWLFASMILLAVIVAALIYLDSRVAKQEGASVTVSLGDKTCRLKVGESAIFPTPSGGAIYVMHLNKQLVQRPASMIGKEEE